MRKPQIPLLLLGGFLGAGKTTLLAQLLEYEQRCCGTPGVIVNEWGPRGIDGALVPGGSALKELVAGCVCCSLQSELLTALDELLATDPSRIYVELTGLADPCEVLELLAGAGVRERVGVALSVVLVDGGAFMRDCAREPLLEDQVRAADVLVLNKSDVREGPVREALESLNPGAKIIETEEARVDVEALLALALTGSGPKVSRGSATHGYRAEVVEFPTAISRAQLEEQMARWSREAVRAKGIVMVEGEGEMLVQVAGGRGRVYPMSVGSGLGWEVVVIARERRL